VSAFVLIAIPGNEIGIFLFSYEQLEDTAQAIELFTQASNLAPTDPGILAKLGELYDSEGDKSQAFQCHYDVSLHAFEQARIYLGPFGPFGPGPPGFSTYRGPPRSQAREPQRTTI
jgi:tetratricopeptide (TPR) repeat protein